VSDELSDSFAVRSESTNSIHHESINPSTERGTMKAYQHIERAETLIRKLDSEWDAEGHWTGLGPWTEAPTLLILAQIHLQLAQVKILGNSKGG
jgi:hypothetical protein